MKDLKPQLISAAQNKKNKLSAAGKQKRLKMIAETAYYKAQARGFVAGQETQDWLDAENEVDQLREGKAA